MRRNRRNGNYKGKLTTIHQKGRLCKRTHNYRSLKNEDTGNHERTRPDMSAATDVRKSYWDAIKFTIRRTTCEDFLFCGTAGSGEFIRNRDADGEFFGKWTKADDADKGYGGDLFKQCKNNNLFIEDTFLFPK